MRKLKVWMEDASSPDLRHIESVRTVAVSPKKNERHASTIIVGKGSLLEDEEEGLTSSLGDRYARILTLSYEKRIVVNTVKSFLLSQNGEKVLHLVTGTSDGVVSLWKYDLVKGFTTGDQHTIAIPYPSLKNERGKLIQKERYFEDNDEGSQCGSPDKVSEFVDGRKREGASTNSLDPGNGRKLWIEKEVFDQFDTPEITAVNYYYTVSADNKPILRILCGTSSGELYFWNFDEYLQHLQLEQISPDQISYQWVSARQMKNRRTAKKNDVVNIELLPPTRENKTFRILIGTNDGFYQSFEWDEKHLEFEEIGPQNFQESGHFDQLLGITYFLENVTLRPIIVSVGWDKIILFWNWGENDFSRCKTDTHTKAITAVCRYSTAFKDSTKQDFLITGSLDTTIIIWELRPTHLQKIHQLIGHTDLITCVKMINEDDEDDRYDVNGSPIVSGSMDYTIRLWDFITGHAIRVINYVGRVKSIDLYLNNGNLTIIGGYDNSTVVVWNLKKKDELRDWVKTHPVTSIVVRKINDRNRPNQVLIYVGDTKGKQYPFYFDKVTCRFQAKELAPINIHYPVRINASILFQERFLISCDGDAYIKVCDLDAIKTSSSCAKAVFGMNYTLSRDVIENHKNDIILSESKHAGCVMSIAYYHPNRFGEDIIPGKFRNKNNLNNSSLLSIQSAWLFSAGLDLTLRAWSLDKFLNNETNEEFSIESRTPKQAFVLQNAHKAMIRWIVVHHPKDDNYEPTLFTGSYDKSVRQWSFNLIPIREFTGLHSDRIMFIDIYDPFIHFRKPSNPSLHLITTSYDQTVGVWEVDKIPRLDDPTITEEIRKQTIATAISNGNIKQLIGHTESVTALALFVPNSEKDDPLIVTGSIDSTMKIWNLKTGKLVRTRSGHSDRICFLTVIGRDPETAIILSGSDDKTTVVWRDSLYQFAYMPFPGSITRIEHIYQLHKAKKWSLISDLANQYRESFFFENPSLFSKAIEEKASSFIVKYRDCLSKILPALTSYREADCLTVALDQNDLIALRVILICWIENLNKDHADILMQKISHPSYSFPYQTLPKLKKKYPNEFILFISSISLVRNFCFQLYDPKDPDGDIINDKRNDDSILVSATFGDYRFHPDEPYKTFGSDHRVNHVEDWKQKDWRLTESFLFDLFLQMTFPYFKPSEFFFWKPSKSKTIVSPTQVTTAAAIAIQEENNKLNGLSPFNLLPSNTAASIDDKISRVRSRMSKRGIMEYYLHEDNKEMTSYVMKDIMDYVLGWANKLKRMRHDKSPVTSMMVPFHHFRPLPRNCPPLASESSASSSCAEKAPSSSSKNSSSSSSTDDYNLFTLLTMLVEVSEKTGNVELFKSEVVIILINYAWNEYGRKAHSTAFARYIFFLIAFVIANFAHYIYYYSHAYTDDKTTAFIIMKLFLSFILFIILCYVFGEFIQIKRQFAVYVKNHIYWKTLDDSAIFRRRIIFIFRHFTMDIWNLIDFFLYFTVIIGIAIRIKYNGDPVTGRCFLAVGTVISYGKILYFLRPYSFSGPLITMIGRVFNRIIVFIFILFLVLIAYAQAIWLLNNNDRSLLFGTMPSAMYYAYFYMLGQNVSGDFTGATQANFSTALLISFMLINLVLLNLMIALMNDEFNTVQEDQIAYWRRERAKIILDQQFLFPETSFRTYLHVLKPSAEVDSSQRESESLKKLKELVELSEKNISSMNF